MEDAKKFIVNQGCCPKCGSERLDYYDTEHNDDYFIYNCRCVHCKFDFEEVYKIVYNGFNYIDAVGKLHMINEEGNEV